MILALRGAPGVEVCGGVLLSDDVGAAGFMEASKKSRSPTGTRLGEGPCFLETPIVCRAILGIRGRLDGGCL